MKKSIFLAIALIGIIAVASIFYNNYKDSDPSQLEASGVYSDMKNENQTNADNNTASSNNNNSGNHTEENSNVIPAMDFTVYNEAEETIHLSDFYSKPIVVNFWATWCGPCKSELPAFEQLYQEYGTDITFMMVNLTDGAQETMSTVRDFITEHDYSFPVYFDTEANAALTYSVYSIPATLFIDADGNIVASHMGAMSESTLRNYIKNLQIPTE